MNIDRTSWRVPPLFALIRSQGNVSDAEMYRTFNMGAGMLVVVSPDDAAATVATIGDHAWIIGEIVPRTDEPVVLT